MKINLLLAGLGIVCTALSGEMHDFTDQGGRTLSATILKHDAATGKVQLETANGRVRWADPLLFSEADQIYIKMWIASEPFRNPNTLRIAIQEHPGDWVTVGKAGFSSSVRKEKKTKFTIRLQNTSTVELQRLRLEYCIYHAKKDGSMAYLETKNFRKLIGTLDPKEAKEVKTVSCRSSRVTMGGPEDEVVGGRFRIYMPVKGGMEYMREICYPKALSEQKYPWKDLKPGN